jgi:hypothetical protein
MLGVFIVLALYCEVWIVILSLKYFYKKRNHFYKELRLKLIKDFNRQLESFKIDNEGLFVANKLASKSTKFKYTVDVKKMIPKIYRHEYFTELSFFYLENYLEKQSYMTTEERDYTENFILFDSQSANYTIEILIL